MTKITEFYYGSGDPYAFEDIVHGVWSDEKLDACHDYIQWLFPTDEPSQFCNAPLVSEEDKVLFQTDEELGNRLTSAAKRFFEFLGLDLTVMEDEVTDDEVTFDPTVIVVRGDNFSERRPYVWKEFNHNWLRITRVLRSLQVLGCAELAQAFFVCLQGLRDSEGIAESGTSFSHWEKAME